MAGTSTAPSASTSSAAHANARKPAKGSKQSKIVVLSLSPDKLAQFLDPSASQPSKQVPRKNSAKSKASSSSTSTPKAAVASASPVDNASDSNSTPAPGGTPGGITISLPGEASKRKGIPGPKPGTKRGAPLGPDGLPKPRGKPGPKKKAKLDDGAEGTDGGSGLKTSFPIIAPLHTTKLGPKANQGAINAGLRALDRTGKPCRKWIKKGLQIKSFTGVVWQLPTWRAPKAIKPESDGTANGDSQSANESDGKENKESSGPASEEKSNSPGDVEMGGLESSPAPQAIATAA